MVGLPVILKQPIKVRLTGSYGKVCINNGVVNKRVPKDNVRDYLKSGWKLGFKKRS